MEMMATNAIVSQKLFGNNNNKTDSNVEIARISADRERFRLENEEKVRQQKLKEQSDIVEKKKREDKMRREFEMKTEDERGKKLEILNNETKVNPFEKLTG